MSWWVWMVLGLVIAALEVQVPSNFFLVGVGLSALIVGAGTRIGLLSVAWVQWLLFSVFSVAAVLLLQRRFRKSGAARWRADAELDNLVGEIAIPSEDLVAGAVGKAELRGSLWSARNAGARPLHKGQRCRVERVEGLTVWLRAE